MPLSAIVWFIRIMENIRTLDVCRATKVGHSPSTRLRFSQMLFTSYTFALFVVAAFGVYYLAARLSRGRRLQNLALLALSYVFYALWDWRWCLLLLCVTASGFGAGLLLERPRARRRTILVVVLVIDLAILAAFKYLGFFAESFASFFSSIGLNADWVTLHLALPVGLSYYVFQNLSYVIDVYRRQLPATTGVVEYATALSFFPQLLAGPITRPRDLLPQLFQRRGFDDRRARDGLRQILWGLTKKVLIADNIGAQVDEVWSNIGEADGVTLAITAVLYSFQIYCDFSGYADMAIGTAKLFNLRLSKNFDYPYFSTSIRDFWRRWHITLAGWMRDYLYIPLGGSRCGVLRHTFNVLVTFVVVGLWHGANPTYLVWGLFHGLCLSVENLFRRARRSKQVGAAETEARGLLGRVTAGVVVFVLVTFAWIFFRAPSLTAAVDFLAQGVTHPVSGGEYVQYLPMLAVSGALLVYERLTRRWEHGFAFGRAPLSVRWAVYLVVCVVLLLFGQFGGQQGIYVQF